MAGSGPGSGMIFSKKTIRRPASKGKGENRPAKRRRTIMPITRDKMPNQFFSGICLKQDYAYLYFVIFKTYKIETKSPFIIYFLYRN